MSPSRSKSTADPLTEEREATVEALCWHAARAVHRRAAIRRVAGKLGMGEVVRLVDALEQVRKGPHKGKYIDFGDVAIDERKRLVEKTLELASSDAGPAHAR